MDKKRFFATLMLSGALGMGVVACEDKGPAEKAGEKIDNAAKDVKQGAEKAADKVEDAADKLEDKVDGK